MGKSNNMNDKYNIDYKKFTNLHNYLKINEIKILQQINQEFIKNFIVNISNFIGKEIQLNDFFINVNSYTKNDKKITYLYSNLIKLSPINLNSFVFVSENFLPIIADFLFGGGSSSEINYYKSKIKRRKNMTYLENRINKKIIQLIISTYSTICNNFFSINMKFINAKIINIQKNFFDTNDIFITNYFNFNLNGANVFISILMPLLVFKRENNNSNVLITKNINLGKVIVNNDVILNNVYDIELNIHVKLMQFSITKDKINNLSQGDIWEIKKPDKVSFYVENKPIFLCSYNIFNHKFVIFLEELINNKN